MGLKRAAIGALGKSCKIVLLIGYALATRIRLYRIRLTGWETILLDECPGSGRPPGIAMLPLAGGGRAAGVHANAERQTRLGLRSKLALISCYFYPPYFSGNCLAQAPFRGKP